MAGGTTFLACEAISCFSLRFEKGAYTDNMFIRDGLRDLTAFSLFLRPRMIQPIIHPVELITF